MLATACPGICTPPCQKVHKLIQPTVLQLSFTFWHCHLSTLAQEKEKDQSRLTTQNWSSCTFSITNVAHLMTLAYGMTSAPKKRGFERPGKDTSTAFLLSLNIPDNLLFLSHRCLHAHNTLTSTHTHKHTHTNNMHTHTYTTHTQHTHTHTQTETHQHHSRNFHSSSRRG